MLKGSEFHARQPEQLPLPGKARSPTVDRLVAGTTRSMNGADRSLARVGMSTTRWRSHVMTFLAETVETQEHRACIRCDLGHVANLTRSRADSRDLHRPISFLA